MSWLTNIGRISPLFSCRTTNVVNYESNFYSGDDDHNTLSGLGSPQSSSAVTPLINADIRYTFAYTRTQIFLGNLI